MAAKKLQTVILKLRDLESSVSEGNVTQAQLSEISELWSSLKYDFKSADAGLTWSSLHKGVCPRLASYILHSTFLSSSYWPELYQIGCAQLEQKKPRNDFESFDETSEDDREEDKGKEKEEENEKEKQQFLAANDLEIEAEYSKQVNKDVTVSQQRLICINQK